MNNENLVGFSGVKLKTRQRINLLNDLASGTYTLQALADKYDRAIGTIHHYKTKYADEIAAIAADHENEYAGIWVADKKQRLAAYLQDIEEIDEMQDPDTGMRRTRQAALKAVAEELGQLPIKSSVEHTGRVQVAYQVGGIDVEGDLT